MAEVTVVRLPCRFGEATATVTPGRARPWLSLTCPEMVPVVLCAVAGSTCRSVATIRASPISLGRIRNPFILSDSITNYDQFVTAEKTRRYPYRPDRNRSLRRNEKGAKPYGPAPSQCSDDSRIRPVLRRLVPVMS